MSYDLRTIDAPRIEGGKLLFAAWLMERRGIGRAVAAPLMSRLGIDDFRAAHYDEVPIWYPVHDSPSSHRFSSSAGVREEAPPPTFELLEQIGSTFRPAGSFAFPSMADYARAYRDGSLTPPQVANRIIHVLEHRDRGNPPLNAFISWSAEEIRRQAQESQERLASGSARSVLEGVPIAIKDELDVADIPTTLGTSFRTITPAHADAWIVARLREAGALIIGKTNMHEVGLGVTGLNPFWGTPVNPYAPWRYPGGSSSGSAGAVAAGICPAAIGADGGGSVRIPAAYCGVFGLKLTAGRASTRGAFPLANTVGVSGPIAGNARDLALTYLTIAGPDPDDSHSVSQPPVTLDDFLAGPTGVRIGIYRPWFEDGREEVVATAQRLIDFLEKAGAEIVEIEIPELDSLRLAHLITITTEMRAGLAEMIPDHRSDFGNETRANLALARHLTTDDYIKAQQVRARLLGHFSAAFERVDVIATPTTANLPPRLNRDRLLSGVSDLGSLSATMRYAIPANMLGYPAVSVPAGFVTAHSRRFWHEVDETDEDGNIYSDVPVGVQFMGRHWEEALLLRMARICEELVVRPRPRVYLSAFESNNPVEAGHTDPVNE
ncbi:MAG: amidase [Spirochaeta sp.]|jgi:Asp-tRNA(Asn)/Glu-tRNA(Gln) amidotransferase A subunit family amidase|nr:amidase [Spirochaeta sp.]